MILSTNSYTRLNKHAKSGITLEVVSFFRRNPGIFFSSSFAVSVLREIIKKKYNYTLNHTDIMHRFYSGYLACLDFRELNRMCKKREINIDRLIFSEEKKPEECKIFHNETGYTPNLYFAPYKQDVPKIMELVDIEKKRLQEKFTLEEFTLEKFILEEYLLKKPVVKIRTECRPVKP